MTKISEKFEKFIPSSYDKDKHFQIESLFWKFYIFIYIYFFYNQRDDRPSEWWLDGFLAEALHGSLLPSPSLLLSAQRPGDSNPTFSSWFWGFLEGPGAVLSGPAAILNCFYWLHCLHWRCSPGALYVHKVSPDHVAWRHTRSEIM